VAGEPDEDLRACPALAFAFACAHIALHIASHRISHRKRIALSRKLAAASRAFPAPRAVTWRRCRRCQAQFDASAPPGGGGGGVCRYHPARFECGSGEPFRLRHVSSGVSGGEACADDCEGRFPCCGARFVRNAADGNGCRSAGEHVAA
jgi:hypothetical protein